MAAARKLTQKSADAYRSIGEAAGELGLQTHVLRYWEGKFPKQLKPVKRGDGRRMFRPADMQALRAIQCLVHERGMTLKGAKQILNEQGVDAVLDGGAVIVGSATVAPQPSPARELQESVAKAFDATPNTGAVAEGSRSKLETVLSEMNDLKARLDAARMKVAA